MVVKVCTTTTLQWLHLCMQDVHLTRDSWHFSGLFGSWTPQFTPLDYCHEAHSYIVGGVWCDVLLRLADQKLQCGKGLIHKAHPWRRLRDPPLTTHCCHMLCS